MLAIAIQITEQYVVSFLLFFPKTFSLMFLIDCKCNAFYFQIFVGGLDANVTDDELKSIFGQFGELLHVKIPPGKRCGFVQYANRYKTSYQPSIVNRKTRSILFLLTSLFSLLCFRATAEHALSVLNGTQLGGQSIRLSWGRSPNKQVSLLPVFTFLPQFVKSIPLKLESDIMSRMIT